MMNPENIIVVLVQPQGPINIGSVCRTMMNFGFTKLRLVNPTKEYKNLNAKKMALTAFKVLEQASVHDTLEQALEDVHAAFGTTRRFGKYRKDFYTPRGAAGLIQEELSGQTCAMVMGPEDTGLVTKDLDLCQHFITIPTHDMYPSMNLSHALSILLYELSLETETGKKFTDPAGKKPAPGKELEQMFAHMRKTLLDIEYLDPQNPGHLLRTFRRIFGQAGLTSRDTRIIRGLMSRIDWTEEQRRKHSNVHSK